MKPQTNKTKKPKTKTPLLCLFTLSIYLED